MSNQGYPQQQHHGRFYIFMITLVIMGVFVLLFLNNDGNGFSITNAIIKGVSNDTEDITANEGNGLDFLSSKTTAEKILTKDTRVFPFSLTFDQAPMGSKGTEAKGIELKFSDSNAKITINDDHLKLNNLQEIDLKIGDFSGEIVFGEDQELSLSGLAKSLEVNGIVFSSEKEIKVNFDGLEYNSLKFSEAALKNLDLVRGNGELNVGEKLNYDLEDDEVKILYFEGGINIDKNSNSSLVAMQGNCRGLSVGGELLDLNLR